MSTEDNKALVSRYFNAAWNQGNSAVIDELFAANFHSGALDAFDSTPRLAICSAAK